MCRDLNSRFKLISSDEICIFIKSNKNTLRILEAMESHLKEHFPNSVFSLEVCDELAWTTETKLLLNVQVNEEMFFNEMLTHFNEIYKEIEPVIRNIENTVVLFPEIEGKDFNKMDINSAINLIARTAYFNNFNDGMIQREVGFREIPKEQQEKEIMEYCKCHKNPNISDIVFDLQLNLFDVDDIIDELEEKGISLNVRY